MQETRVEVHLCETGEEFAALEGEWDELYQSCPAATPFQSWAWLYSWWENFGEGYELKLASVRDGSGLLIGVLPLMKERRMGFSRLLFVGAKTSDYLDLLAREGWEAQVAQAARRLLAQDGGWDLVDLQQLRPEAAAWELFKIWDGPAMRLKQGVCPVIEVDDWERMLARLSRNRRSTARRAVRRMREDGAGFRLARSERVERAARRFVVLHRLMWAERGITPEHLSGRFEEHIAAAARRMTERDLGAISELWLGEEVVASQFLVTAKDSVGGFLSGATPWAVKRYQVSSVFVYDGAGVARERNVPLYDFLRGDEDYKFKWRPTVIPLDRAVLGRSALPWAAFVAHRAARSGISRARQLYERKKTRTPQSGPPND